MSSVGDVLFWYIVGFCGVVSNGSSFRASWMFSLLRVFGGVGVGHVWLVSICCDCAGDVLICRITGSLGCVSDTSDSRASVGFFLGKVFGGVGV